MKKQLRHLDSCLVYLLKKLKLHGLLDTMNVILTSDHGMERMHAEHQIYLNQHVDTNLFDIYGTYHNMNLFMKNGM
jgi:predicted AlkP superfamily pyrophosphatase or phosphodiesterase